MINGNTIAIETFDPAGDLEVNEVLPTASGLYLEEVRKATQAHLRRCADLPTNAANTNGEEYEEIMDGPHPYRDIRVVPCDPGHPHQGWFWK